MGNHLMISHINVNRLHGVVFSLQNELYANGIYVKHDNYTKIMGSGAVACAFCFVCVIIVIIVVVLLINNEGGGGGGGYYGGGGGGYRSRGGGWGCFSASTIVWTKNETESDTMAKEITIDNLQEGNLVGTFEPLFHQNIEY